ncbi:hypothetical protein CNMCM5793_008754 [Aspergillus hiratsukae]|uniref:Uncharacterized protein n=1 Tax=Aspergillus hiratsukae TaxID=1194566 RepID=A0A8H6P0P4_9EURO|nr:hypothetical protein CNMCM5793_008754 [Aspergillus hiratsukae]KAF7157980.1 hypothetical protein CNMCM6106_004269 [Aspergillus hiratsukae]
MCAAGAIRWSEPSNYSSAASRPLAIARKGRNAAQARIRKARSPRPGPLHPLRSTFRADTPLQSRERPHIPQTAVTLTTSKHQDAWAYTIPKLEPESAGQTTSYFTIGIPSLSALLHSPVQKLMRLFGVCPWCDQGYSGYMGAGVRFLHHLLKMPSYATPGQVLGGSGGVAKGMCADVAATWIEKWFGQYLKEEEFWRTYQSKKSYREMLRNSEASIRSAKMVLGTRGGVAKGKL